MMRYRIREAIYEHCTGYSSYRQRGFLAERERSFFGLFTFWSPLEDGNWTTYKEQALRDIENDKAMRAPLPAPVIVE